MAGTNQETRTLIRDLEHATSVLIADLRQELEQLREEFETLAAIVAKTEESEEPKD